jgi:hypothetical protein
MIRRRNGPGNRGATARAAAALTVASAVLFAGCHTTVPLPQADPDSPAWRLTESPAVWRPALHSPELAGELLVANGPDSARVVQFSKQGLPMVAAQVTPERWRLTSSLRPRAYTGRMPPRRAVLWLVLDGLPPSARAPAPWLMTTNPATSSWRLTHPGTGEFLEVYPASPAPGP